MLPPGTRNVLTTCKEAGVKKVVLTSSMAAIYATYGTLAADHAYGEKTWSPRELVREKGNWYCLSKTLAEELAWDMSREEDSPFQLCTINPVRLLCHGSVEIYIADEHNDLCACHHSFK